MKSFTTWLTGKWSRTIEPSLLEDYRMIFNTDSGRRVLRHWLDQVYCSVYQGTDPLAAAHHNGRRSIIHEILETLDAADNPKKYEINSGD